jgi:endoglucanase
MRRCLCFGALTGLGLLLLGSATSQAAVTQDAASTPGTVSLDQPSYTAHEAQGYLSITIERTGDLSAQEHVGYGVKRQDAQPGIDFDTIPNTYVTFQPGQSSYTFSVRIIDQGLNGTPVHALAYLYGSYPDSLGANNNSLITILHDDPLQPRDDANPLGVSTPLSGGPVAAVSTPVSGNPIAGTKFYVDPTSSAAQAEKAYSNSRPAWAKALSDIADEPAAHRFYMWNMGSNVVGQVAHYLEGTQVEQPGTTVMLSTYTLVHGKCGSTATPAIEARYDNFMQQAAAGIGNFHVVFFLELDSLITAPCLNRNQLAIRDAELKYAVTALESDPHTVVYLDGGAADAASAGRQARYLTGAGVQQAQGFFLNSTHFDWTSSELHYGQQISRLLGGKHFVINSGENGRGPLRPKNRVRDGNEVLCNPPGRGLGPLTLSNDVAQQTGYADADGFLWFSNPGGSGGQCVPGAPPTGVYWPAYAVKLAQKWVHKVSGPRYDLIHEAK